MKKRKSKKRNKFETKFFESVNFVKDSRKFIYLIILIFFLFFLIGFIIPAPESILNQILDFVKKLIEQTKDLSGLELFWFIFWNNLKVSFVGMLTGLLFGVFPIFTSIGNGYLLGFVSALTSKSEGIFSLWKLFPHGVFELPAIFISLGLGLRLGMFLFRKKKESFREEFIDSLEAFLFIVLPLLLVAAIIESGLIVLLG